MRIKCIALIIISSFMLACGGSGSGDGGIPSFNIYYSVAVGDLNGDGLLDVTACYSYISGPPPHPGYVVVYLQDPAHPGTFLAAKIYPVGNDPTSIAISDLNGDGRLDIVTANSILSADGYGASTVSVLLQDSNAPGKFLPASNYATGTNPVFVTIGDLNGDGRTDLAVADRDGISVLFQNPASPGTFLPRTPISVGGATSSVAIADLNGDGKQDLVATRWTGVVLVILQDPSVVGSFLTPTSYIVGAQPYSSAVGDLNADGKPDLAISLFGSVDNGSGAGVAVLLQNPSLAGSFLSPVHYNTEVRPEAVVIADLIGDGKADLVVSNSGGLAGICPPNCGSAGTSVSILFQMPAFPGQFQNAINYPATGSSFITWVAVGDINDDGRPDLVIAQADGLLLRLQDPLHPGQFLAAVPIPR